jgi:hypothetical protein
MTESQSVYFGLDSEVRWTRFPVGPGDVVFGKPVERRTLHSVRTYFARQSSVSASKRRIQRVRFQWVATALGDVLWPALHAATAAAAAAGNEQFRSIIRITLWGDGKIRIIRSWRAMEPSGRPR